MMTVLLWHLSIGVYSCSLWAIQSLCWCDMLLLYVYIYLIVGFLLWKLIITGISVYELRREGIGFHIMLLFFVTITWSVTIPMVLIQIYREKK